MTFYFYDLETSGINARAQRIMQFAGQRTDSDFNPIGEPENWLVKLTDEILPDPDAIMITGITPQKTLEEGYSEVEFIKLFLDQVCQPDTTILGYNSIRFDDEFMRATLWRNFYDPYEWQWQDGRSRWDLLDVVRMIRALRPEGIDWPFAPARKPGSSEHGPILDSKPDQEDKSNLVPTNRLELLTSINRLSHENAHDALSDVMATIAVAKLLKNKQPKIFDYLLDMRDKKKVAKLFDLSDPKPFLYTSGRYSQKWLNTTAVVAIGEASHGSVLVYDLRMDPAELAKLSDEQLTEIAFIRHPETEILPVKVLKPNACPAVAPLGVLDDISQERLNLTHKTISENYNKLFSIPELTKRLTKLFNQNESERKQGFAKEDDADFKIYDGFVEPHDKSKMRALHSVKPTELNQFLGDFKDSRLNELLPRFIARNFPKNLDATQRQDWEQYRTKRITEGLKGQLSVVEFSKRLAQLSAVKTDEQAKFLLEELQLYAQNIMPAYD